MTGSLVVGLTDRQLKLSMMIVNSLYGRLHWDHRLRHWVLP